MVFVKQGLYALLTVEAARKTGIPCSISIRITPSAESEAGICCNLGNGGAIIDLPPGIPTLAV